MKRIDQRAAAKSFVSCIDASVAAVVIIILGYGMVYYAPESIQWLLDSAKSIKGWIG